MVQSSAGEPSKERPPSTDDVLIGNILRQRPVEKHDVADIRSASLADSTPKTRGGKEIPFDIIRHILWFTRVPDLMRCLHACQSLYKMANDVLIQYKIDAYFAGAQVLTDETNAKVDTLTKTTLHERLSFLRNREASWRALRPIFRECVSLPFQYSNIYYLSGGVLVLGERSSAFGAVGSTGTSALRYATLPRTKYQGITWQLLDLGKDIIDFGLSVHEYDLIAVATTSPSPHDPSLVSITITLIELSTGQRHPLAAQPNLPVLQAESGFSNPLVCIKIAGKYLALTLTFSVANDPEDRLFVFEWMSGKLIWDYSTTERMKYRSIIFLSQTTLLIPNVTGPSALDVWELAPNQVTLVGSLLLPKLSPGSRYRWFLMDGEPSPYPGHLSSSCFQSAVRYDPEASIIAFEVEIRQEVPFSIINALLVAHRRSLLSVVDQLRATATMNFDLDGEPPSLEYSEWGPRITRWIPTPTLSTEWGSRSAGQRVVAISKDAELHGGALQIFDFNPFHVRKWGEDAIDVGSKDGSSSSNAEQDNGEVSPPSRHIPSSPPQAPSPSLPDLFVQKTPSDIPFDVMENYPPSELAYVAYESEEVFEYSGVLMDEGIILGIKRKDYMEISAIDIWYFG